MKTIVAMIAFLSFHASVFPKWMHTLANVEVSDKLEQCQITDRTEKRGDQCCRFCYGCSSSKSL
jgi:hypothetical protein